MGEWLRQSFSTSWFGASSGAYISKLKTASYRLSSIRALRLKRTDQGGRPVISNSRDWPDDLRNLHAIML
jgi:hypothetical protein